MQQRAREHYGPTRRGFEAARPVLGETDFAALELRIEIDRDRKAAMDSSRRRVVAMCPEVAAVLCRVAGDDVALHPRYSELVNLQDFGNDPPPDTGLGLLDQVRVRDDVILTDLVIAILHADGLAVDLTHEAALLASMGLVETYQMATELKLEHIGQEQDRGLQINASKAPRRRKLPEILNERAILGQRQDLEYAQRWIKHNPKPAQRDRIARSLLPWCGPVQAAYRNPRRTGCRACSPEPGSGFGRPDQCSPQRRILAHHRSASGLQGRH